jgi:hypothetical protein
MAMDIFQTKPSDARGYANIIDGLDPLHSFVLNFYGKFATAATTSIIKESGKSNTIFL